MKFKLINPKKSVTDPCIVQCPDYCPSGYFIATWDGDKWETDLGDDITEWVVGWLLIK
jgi:hypothetical protein